MLQGRKIQSHWKYILGVLVVCAMILMVKLPVCAQSGLQLQVQVQDSSSVLLQWESEDAEADFRIYRSTDGGNSYKLFATVSEQTGMVQCYDQQVALGKTYWYKLVRMSGEEICQESTAVKVKVTLAIPSGLRTKVIKKSRVQLTWNKVAKANRYTIYRSTKKDKGYKKIATTKTNTYTDYTVSRGTTYYYKIVATHKKNTNWKSQKSEAVSAHLKLIAPALSSVYTKKKIKLTWNKVKGADSYYVYKKNSKGKFELVGKTSKLYYKDSKVTSGKAYIYKVVAVATVDGKIMKGDACKAYKAWASKVDPSKKMVALTYDDGPSIYTDDIVQCLKANNAKATFFVLGCNVDAHKQALVEAYKMGCEIGNHTYSHPMLSGRSNEEIKREIESTDKKIKGITGKKASIMRPPGGDVNDRVAQVVNKPIILWSIDTRDWEHRNSTRVVQSIVGNVKDGDIILMHDIYKSTQDASLVVIPQLRRMGYQMVTISELAQYRGIEMKKSRIYRSFRKK